MSLSKSVCPCAFCKRGKGIYSCPRCHQKYCSTICYKSREHAECSETFFSEWVEQTLQQKVGESDDKERMLDILKRLRDDSVEDEELSIEDRLRDLNIEEADENTIWQALNEEEKSKFKALVKDVNSIEDVMCVKQPWWMTPVITFVTDTESTEVDSKDKSVMRPPYPLNCKRLSELTSIKPSPCIPYNLTNILYAYAFLNRIYNCDVRDFLEEAVESLLSFSPVLSHGKNYQSLPESLQDTIRIIMDSESKPLLSFVKSIVSDVETILHGPTNGKAFTYTVCALHDIKLIFLELKQAQPKISCKVLTLATKKIEYLMSWCLENESSLSDLASDLVLVMLPDLVPSVETFKEPCNTTENKCLISSTENCKEPSNKRENKCLIEELD